MTTAVQTRRHGAVTLVTLCRPNVRNAVDAPTALALYQAFLAFDADSDAKVAVFHGDHGHFCAGWDLQAAAREATRSAASAQSLASAFDFDTGDGPVQGPMGPSRLLVSKPVIAAVSGAAVAGGMELALWCDMRVMEQDAYFGIYCRRFGVPLIDGGTVRLPRLIGMGHAMDLILTGRRVDPPEALQMGLCNRVVPTGSGLAAALELAEQLAVFPQATMRADRSSAYAQWDLPMAQALHQEWVHGKACLGDALQGASQFAGGAGRHGKF